MDSTNSNFRFDSTMYAENFPYASFMGPSETEPAVTSSIDCVYQLWQNIVLTGLSLSSTMSKQVTTSFVCNHLSRELTHQEIAHTMGDGEVDIDWLLNQASHTLPLRSSVKVYLEFLREQGYIVLSRNEIGFDGGFVYSLTSKFVDVLQRASRS